MAINLIDEYNKSLKLKTVWTLVKKSSLAEWIHWIIVSDMQILTVDIDIWHAEHYCTLNIFACFHACFALLCMNCILIALSVDILCIFYYCIHGCVCQLDIKENDDDDDDWHIHIDREAESHDAAAVLAAGPSHQRASAS